ncbi:MAG: zinc-ribbon and DUF3426 domain-containing protein [Zoogloeaceae bacterium]|jgi:predicted Zn finger-like uncharacterized protein|nr:zinc-ribbon and DUF3426 domain-containing protein [Zoogloeaceae bacterium]
MNGKAGFAFQARSGVKNDRIPTATGCLTACHLNNTSGRQVKIPGMLTRCPHCQTVCRASQEQLALHHGQVRCGVCHHPFNAHAHLVEEDEALFLLFWQEDESQPELPLAGPDTTHTPHIASTASFPDEHSPGLPLEEDKSVPETSRDPIDELLSSQAVEEPSQLLSRKAQQKAQTGEDHLPFFRNIFSVLARQKAQTGGKILLFLRNAFSVLAQRKAQTGEGIHQHDLRTGIATRYMRKLPEFSVWRADPLNSGQPSYALWPFTLTAIFFAFLLFVQTVLYFRGEISHNSPAFTSLFQTLGIDLPLARDPGQLSIIGDELQTLEELDRLRLFLTLRNKARYPLAWPHLEVSLSDAYNTVLVRKVFSPDEYLTREQAEGAFAPGDVPIRLELGARAIAPSRYNLYLFYP